MTATGEDPKENILARLRASSEVVSGSELSRILDISRVSVWKHIQRLRQCGYEIEATPNGYRLTADVDSAYPWEFPGRKGRFHYFRQLASTMDPAREMARGGCPHFTVVVAEQQSAGRGRLDRSWHSASGGLYFTVVLRPQLPPALTPRLNLCASLVLAETLRDDYNLPAMLKWPNDVLVEGKKIAGMLAEMEAEADRVSYANIGIGVNVNNDPTGAESTSVAMQQLIGRPVSRKKMLAAFLDRFEARIAAGNLQSQIEKWKMRAVTIGRQVKIVTLQGETEGTAVDIDSNGSLILRLTDGSLQTIVYGDCFHL